MQFYLPGYSLGNMTICHHPWRHSRAFINSWWQTAWLLADRSTAGWGEGMLCTDVTSFDRPDDGWSWYAYPWTCTRLREERRSRPPVCMRPGYCLNQVNPFTWSLFIHFHCTGWCMQATLNCAWLACTCVVVRAWLHGRRGGLVLFPSEECSLKFVCLLFVLHGGHTNTYTADPCMQACRGTVDRRPSRGQILNRPRFGAVPSAFWTN